MHAGCNHCRELIHTHTLSMHRSGLLVRHRFWLPAYMRVTIFLPLFGCGNGSRLICKHLSQTTEKRPDESIAGSIVGQIVKFPPTFLVLSWQAKPTLKPQCFVTSECHQHRGVLGLKLHSFSAQLAQLLQFFTTIYSIHYFLCLA